MHITSEQALEALNKLIACRREGVFNQTGIESQAERKIRAYLTMCYEQEKDRSGKKGLSWR